VGKSSVGYAIFQQVYRSGIKAAYLDFDQVGLCYPSPADDPHNHRVKAQNLGVVWPTYWAAGARCLIAAGGVPSREIVMRYAGQVPIRISRYAGFAPARNTSVSGFSAADLAGAR
jgi:hypothetical protein